MIFVTPKNQWYCTRCAKYHSKIAPPIKIPSKKQIVDQSEYYGAMPDKYDALFYSGMFMFAIMMFMLYYTRNGLTCLAMGLANIVSMYAVYLDFKNKNLSISGTLGNTFAILWIIFAWFLSLAMWALFL